VLAFVSDSDSATLAPQDGLKARRCKCLFSPCLCPYPVTAFEHDVYH